MATDVDAGEETVEHGPYIKLSSSEKDRLIYNLGKIKLLDTWGYVKSLLGPPNVEKALMPKKGKEPVGVVRVYYSYRLSEDLVNEKQDKKIWLFFSNDGTLLEINSNLEEYPRTEKSP